MSGFTIVAERINFLRYLAHFRSVHRGQFFTTMKTTAVRKLLPESWGFLCPVHTPDGSPCGLLNHLATACKVVCGGGQAPPPPEVCMCLCVVAVVVVCCRCCSLHTVQNIHGASGRGDVTKQGTLDAAEERNKIDKNHGCVYEDMCAPLRARVHWAQYLCGVFV